MKITDVSRVIQGDKDAAIWVAITIIVPDTI